MKHIHIALVLLVCSFVTLSCAKSTLVYRRYHRKRPSLRKVQKNIVEIVEVFKTNRKPPAFMKSDKSIEKFLLCDAKCERKRFLKRRKLCLRYGRFCPTRPSGSKSQPTTQINVSTRPIYKKPTIYQTNPYGNRNPDYTHLYPWSRPSVTVTKYQPDRSKDFNMTILEVDNETVVTPNKDDYEYYDTDNDDRYQRRSTTYRVPTTTNEWATPEISTIKTTEATSIFFFTTTPETSIPTTTNMILTGPDTLTLTQPPKSTAPYTESPLIKSTTEPIRSTLATTTETSLSSTDYLTIIQTQPNIVSETTTEFLMPSPPTVRPTFASTTTKATTTTTSTTPLPTTERTTSTTEASTSTSTTTEIPTTPSTTEIPSTTTPSTTEIPSTPTPSTTELPSTTTPSTTTDQTESGSNGSNTELEEDDVEDYVEEYEEEGGEVETEEGNEEGAEEGVEEGAEEENVDVENGNDGAYDYDDDGNYDDEEQV